MITLSVIVGLWMLISLIIVLVEYIKYPNEGFWGTALEMWLIIYIGVIFGITSIIVFSIFFIVTYLP